ncbi:glycosyltransferase family 4 protein [Candidatus Sumerlaeota bacterium]|nr:glycosyltransferase family 4 protein [Candidatus Sumerlaeota bacterium]
MRILLINRFFWPDESSTSMLATDLAEELAAAGHEVHVLCARLLYDRPETPVPAYEIHGGIRIHRLPSTRLGRGTALRRMCDLVSFQFSLEFIGPWKCRPDIIYVMTDPPMVVCAAVWIKLLRGGKIFHHVMDVYPEIAGALGAVNSSSPSSRLLGAIYHSCLKRCAKVIVLGERMAERMRLKGAKEEHIAIVPPWAESPASQVPTGDNSFRRELGIPPDHLLVMYSGNIGKAHCFSAIIEGMKLLKEDERIHFVFIGYGAKRGEIERAVRDHLLSRVRLLPYQPRERLHETLAAADVHLISQEPSSVGLIVPSKLAGILAAGRPAIFVGAHEAEIAQDLENHKCGLFVAANDTSGFVHAIRVLSESSERRRQMGDAAQSLFQSRYSRAACTGAITGMIKSA